MSELSFAQRKQLFEQAHEVFAYEEPERNYPEEAVGEIVDAWLPVYNNQIVEAWSEAGYPEPEEFSQLSEAKSIFQAMTWGLYELAHNALLPMVDTCDTWGEAAIALRDELALTPKQRVERILAS